MKISVDLLIPKENEQDFKSELEQLKNKYQLNESLQKEDQKDDINQKEQKKDDINQKEEQKDASKSKDDSKTKPKENKYLSMMMSDAKKKKKPDQFDTLKTNCWKMYGFKKNIIGEQFQDDPDNSNLFHKIIGFQPKNKETPIITLDDNGMKKEWTIDKICMFLGIPRGYIIEELESIEHEHIKKPVEILKSKTEEPFIETPKEELDENENKYDRNDSTIHVNVKPTLNTLVKCRHNIVIRPENYRDKTVDEKVKHRRAGMPVMKKRTEVKQDIIVREKKSYSELSEMNDTELSLYYGFDKNMVGTIFNQPTPKKGYERLHKITGFNIIKEKYVVVAYCYHTKKSLHFSVEHVKELIELENEKKEVEEKKDEKKEGKEEDTDDKKEKVDEKKIIQKKII